jgi:hypothetical protein
MSASHQKDDSQPPAPQAPAQPDAAKTPLDNLKGILAEVDNVAQANPEGHAATPGPVISEQYMVSKDAIRKALEQAQGFTDEKLSPRQVDSILRPLVESVLAADMQKGLDKEAGATMRMKILKDALGQSKTGPQPAGPGGGGTPAT